MADRRRTAAGDPRGQVLIEVLLMLPIFMLLVFCVMEIGYLAFRTILLHHAAYEAARVGSLVAYPTSASPGGCGYPDVSKAEAAVNRVRRNILKGTLPASVSKQNHRGIPTDPQDGCANYDLVVTLTDDVRMIFPMTGLVLGNVNGRTARRLRATVYMPIERPLFGGKSS